VGDWGHLALRRGFGRRNQPRLGIGAKGSHGTFPGACRDCPGGELRGEPGAACNAGLLTEAREHKPPHHLAGVPPPPP
jgi:hypothetical protein